MTAHRILVATFVAFSLFLALVEFRAWRHRGDRGAGVTAVASLVAAAGFAVYLARLGGQRS